MHRQKCYMVYVTVPDGRTGTRLARELVRRKLAACVNIVPRIRSVYWWQGKIETGNEALLIIKTSGRCLAALERAVHELHPYSVPEFVAVTLDHVAPKYREWLETSIG